jgi:hypothetical protein
VSGCHPGRGMNPGGVGFGEGKFAMCAEPPADAQKTINLV